MFKTIGWTRGDFVDEPGRPISDRQPILGNDSSLMVALFLEYQAPGDALIVFKGMLIGVASMLPTRFGYRRDGAAQHGRSGVDVFDATLLLYSLLTGTIVGQLGGPHAIASARWVSTGCGCVLIVFGLRLWFTMFGIL